MARLRRFIPHRGSKTLVGKLFITIKSVHIGFTPRQTGIGSDHGLDYSEIFSCHTNIFLKSLSIFTVMKLTFAANSSHQKHGD